MAFSSILYLPFRCKVSRVWHNYLNFVRPAVLNRLQRLTSYFYGALGLYLSQLFAVNVLCWGAQAGLAVAIDRNHPNAAAELQHDLRVHVIYTLGLLCDSLFGVPSNFTTLWPYWLILLTTFNFGPYEKPIAMEPVLWIDNLLSSMWDQVIRPIPTYHRPGPFDPLIQTVSGIRRRCCFRNRQTMMPFVVYC